MWTATIELRGYVFKVLLAVCVITPMQVVSESAGASSWILQECGAKVTKRVGRILLFRLPKHAQHSRVWDVDYGYDRIRYPKSNELLLVYSSVYGGDLKPREDALSSVVQPHHRSIEFGGNSGLSGSVGNDYRGVTRQGKNWRWTGAVDTYATYEVSSSEAAAYFDQIIDSACYFKTWQ